MKSLIEEITETLSATLKEQLKSVPKSSIVSEEKAAAKAKAPSVAVINPEFTVEESSLSGSEPERKQIHEETFSGDGRKIEFSLNEKPLRPVFVEHPLGEMLSSPNDYSVDYVNGKVKFRSPPEKGKDNLLVRYAGLKGAAEQRSLQLNLKYLIQVSGEDETERDAITLDVLRSLIIAKEVLERQGVHFKILGGRNDLDHTGTESKTVSMKTIECQAQTKLTIEMPSGVMEKIVVTKQEELP